MSKAKNKAEDAYLDYFLDGRLRNCSRHEAFIYGYCQAEKDLELSWEDLAAIEKLGDDFVKQNHTPMSDEEFYKEVLKRFKEFKERKAK